jgi:anti-anti-sigma factor
MKTDVTTENGHVIVALEGRLDATTTTAFDEAVKDLPGSAQSKKILVDLSNLEFISSAGLRSFLSLGKACRASGAQLGFCSLGALVADVFKISGFVSIFSMFADRAEAFKAWSEVGS